MLVMSVPGGLSIEVLASEGEVRGIINAVSALGVFVYYILAVIYAVAGIGLGVYRFYQNFRTDEAYLTFTLPVKRKTLLNSKLLATVITFLATFLIELTAITISLSVAKGQDGSMLSTVFSDIGAFLRASYASIGFWCIVYICQAGVLAFEALTAVILFCFSIANRVSGERSKSKASVGKNLALVFLIYACMGLISVPIILLVVSMISYGEAVSIAGTITDGESSAVIFLTLIIFTMATVILNVFLYKDNLNKIKNKLNLTYERSAEMKKVLIYILVISSLLLSLASGGKHSEFDDSFTVWETSEDASTLSDGAVTYYRYAELPLGMRIEKSYFSYYNEAVLDGDLYDVYANAPESGILYLYSYTYGIIAYVKEGENTEELDSFLAGNASEIRVINYDRYTYFDADAELVSRLDTLNTDKVNIDVRKLNFADCYDIAYFDSKDTLAYTHGAIYNYEGELYYINYDKLGNNYFDSYGDFSYGRGSVDMYKLPAPLKSEIAEKLDNMENYFEYHTWEGDITGDDEMTRKEAINIIIAITSVLGIVLPIPLLTIGVIFVLRKKGKVDGSTYVLIAAAAIWIIAGIVLLILSL
jgi:hypothetical protein